MDKPWTRSPSGVVLGVCKGLADRFQVDVMMVRIVFLLMFCIGGTGFLFYLILAVSFPKPERLESSYGSKIFGVCHRFSKRFDIELGLVRAGALMSLFLSGGLTLLVYFGLYFVLPTIEEMK